MLCPGLPRHHPQPPPQRLHPQQRHPLRLLWRHVRAAVSAVSGHAVVAACCRSLVGAASEIAKLVLDRAVYIWFMRLPGHGRNPIEKARIFWAEVRGVSGRFLGRVALGVPQKWTDSGHLLGHFLARFSVISGTIFW